MILSEFMEKLNELYVGNERDFGNKKVKIATGNMVRDFVELVVFPDDVVLCDDMASMEGGAM